MAAVARWRQIVLDKVISKMSPKSSRWDNVLDQFFDINQYVGSDGKTVAIKSKFRPPKSDVQKKGHKAILDLLMPLKPKGQNSKIDNAILLAASHGHLDIVKHCQIKGANIEAKSTENGATPLINAAQGGHTPTVMYLINTKGANLNAVTNDDNSTALIMAATGGHFDIVQCLVFKGCDVFVKSKNGTALDIAQKNDHQEIVNFLHPIIDNVENPQKKYFRACTKGDLQEVKSCLKEMKKDSKTKGSKSAEAERKALTKVALAKDFESAPADGTEKDEGKPTNKKDIVFYDRNGKNGKILTSAERKAQTKESGIDGTTKDECKPANMKDVDIQDPDGKTGMMLAGANGHLNVVEYLAKKGAKIDAMDNEGFTALMLSAVNRQRPVVEYLLSQKADVTLQCKYGTALDIMLDLYN